MFLEFMKDTDEAKKVKKNNGKMFWAVYEKIIPQVNSIENMLQLLN